jgi:hypothetical protein
MIGWYNVMHIAAAEIRLLMRVQFVKIGRNAAADRFGDMQNPYRSDLSAAHSRSFTFVTKMQSYLRYAAIFGPLYGVPTFGQLSAGMFPRKRSIAAADLDHE